jgi:hypothetical protein
VFVLVFLGGKIREGGNLCTFQVLGDILLEKSNALLMMRYVSSMENLIILMTLLRVRCRFGI